MPKLTFRGAFIRFVDIRYDEKSKMVYTKINLTSAWTDTIRDAMEWGDPPAGFSSASLDGDFPAKNLTLSPNGMKSQAIDLEAHSISNFTVHRVSEAGGETFTNELRFQIVSHDENAAGVLRDYLVAVGKGQGQLKVAYEKQGSLLDPPDDGQEQLIDKDQAADTAESSDGPTLASVSTMRPKARSKRSDVN